MAQELLLSMRTFGNHMPTTDLLQILRMKVPEESALACCNVEPTDHLRGIKAVDESFLFPFAVQEMRDDHFRQPRLNTNLHL